MATVTDEVQAPSPDDMLEEAVLMQEDVLAGQAEADPNKKYQVYLDIDGKKVPVIDQPESEKFKVAIEAVNKRAANYDQEVYRLASYRLSKMNETEAVDFIAEVEPGDRDHYLRAERAGKNRAAIFKVFGQPSDNKEE